jgi:hypothetical protein
MHKTYLPPELTTAPEKFLTQEWLSRSVSILMEHMHWELSNITSNPQFLWSDLLFLASEVDYHIEGLDWAMYSTNEDLVRLRKLKQESNDRNPSWYIELYNFMLGLISKVWSESSLKIAGFSRWIKEVDGNNSLMASRTLLECTILGTRMWLEKTKLDEWKSKLKDVHRNFVERYTFPEAPKTK